MLITCVKQNTCQDLLQSNVNSGRGKKGRVRYLGEENPTTNQKKQKNVAFQIKKQDVMINNFNMITSPKGVHFFITFVTSA